MLKRQQFKYVRDSWMLCNRRIQGQLRQSDLPTGLDTAKYSGYRVEFGRKRKAVSALSILSMARWWIDEFSDFQIPSPLVDDALDILASMAIWASK